MKIISTTTAFASLAIATLIATAPAGATVIYEFRTTSVTLGDPYEGPGGGWDGLSLTLTLFDGLPATFHGGGCTFGTVGTLASDTHDEVLCNRTPSGEPTSNELLDFTFQAHGPLLTGELSFTGFEDSYRMTSNPGGSMWTGFYGSDFAIACYGAPCAFTGVWRRVSGPGGDTGGPASVPEPAPLLLIGFGLLATFAVRRIGGTK